MRIMRAPVRRPHRNRRNDLNQPRATRREASGIGKLIRDARIAKNLTQRALAKLVEIDQPHLSRVEYGYHLPSVELIERLERVLGTDLPGDTRGPAGVTVVRD